MKFEDYYSLDVKMGHLGLSNLSYEIVELIRQDLPMGRRTKQKAQEKFLDWWNNIKDKPNITLHRLSYFCLYYLRKEFNKKLREKKQ